MLLKKSIHILKIFTKNNEKSKINGGVSMRAQNEWDTDLAMEERERFQGTETEISGVVIKELEEKRADMKVTKVEIKTEHGAKAMRKPMGTYITLEAKELSEESDQAEIFSEILADYMEQLIPKQIKSILAVGLGNQEMTADTLGPDAVNQLWINRHYSEHGQGLSGIVPGVMAKTGMETALIIKGIVKETKPEMVLVIDALAARNAERLGTTIQLTDTGIWPGSGVGNHRDGMNEETLGVPVIAIGVPTVVRTMSMIRDTWNYLSHVLANSEETKEIGTKMQELEEDQWQSIAASMPFQSAGYMYVMPKDMDERVKRLSRILSEGINLAVHSRKFMRI